LKTCGDACFICGSSRIIDSDHNYQRCKSCGHETLKSSAALEPIINDELTKRKIASFGQLDRFKRKILRACMTNNNVLLDVGSASGKFLYQNKQYFQNALGIEVTRECIDFARDQLKLVIHEDLAMVREPVSVATFWHSLEHIPADGIDRLLRELGRIAAPDIRVIISVPNGGSLQRTLFGERYAYYDPGSHAHQFTCRSLDHLMTNYGFVRERAFVSVAYAVFGSLQGLMNLFMNRHNYLYYRKKRGWTFDRSPGTLVLLDVYNYILAAFVLAPALLMIVIDSILPDKGAVLTVCYKKK
jgi:SAM-dependent methyltransferase